MAYRTEGLSDLFKIAQQSWVDSCPWREAGVGVYGGVRGGHSQPLPAAFSLLLLSLVLLGPECPADGPRPPGNPRCPSLPAESPWASQAGDLSRMGWPKARVDLRAWNLLPRGLWGPTGLLLARDLWALDPAGVRGPGTEAWLWGGEIPDVLSLGL